MKKLMTAILLSSSLLVGSAIAETLYVNGKPVDQKVIDQTLNQFKKSSPMAAQQLNNPQFKSQILQSIGMQQAILMEGDSQNLERTDAYKDKLQEVKPMIYAQLFQEKLSNAPVSDAQVKVKYDEMQKQAMNAKQYDVSHILVKDEKTAKEIISKLKEGKNFAALAKKNSIDPGSKTKGGELGLSDGSSYVPEFNAAVQKLQKGTYTTTPVKSQFGYHIIKLNDVKVGNKNAVAPFDKMKDQIKQQLQMTAVKTYFEGLKAKYKVEVK